MYYFNDQDQRRGESYINQTEAVIARDLVIWLKNRITTRHDFIRNNISVGVICLYKAQAWLITKMLSDAGIEVGITQESNESNEDVDKNKNDNGNEKEYVNENNKHKVYNTDYNNDNEDNNNNYDVNKNNNSKNNFYFNDNEIFEERMNNNNDNNDANNNDKNDTNNTGDVSSPGVLGELRVSTVDAFQVHTNDDKRKVFEVFCPILISSNIEYAYDMYCLILFF